MVKMAVSVRIDADVYAALVAEAARLNRSITAQVEFLLSRALQAKMAARLAEQPGDAGEQSGAVQCG